MVTRPLSLILLPLILIACAPPTAVPPISISDTPSAPPPTTTRPAPTRVPSGQHPEALTAQAESRVRLTETAAVITPTATFTALAPTLILEAPEIRIPQVSPDGAWLSFWVPVDQESQPGIAVTALAFYEVTTGALCIHDDITGLIGYELPDTYNFWLPDGRVVAVLKHEPRIGLPCQEFAPADPFWGQSPTAFSPSGRYRATTTHDGTNATILIADIASGAILNQVEWTHRGGQNICCVGGRWMSDDLFLINTAVGRGPLLVRVGGALTDVIPDLFGMQPVTNPNYRDSASGAVDASTGAYHILLDRGSADNSPPLYLYHSETAEIETLPFREMWGDSSSRQFGSRAGFSPDGRWLLMVLPLAAESQDYSQIYTRPVDGSADETRLLGPVTGIAQWSPSGALLAFDAPDGIARVMTFPAGETVAYWEAPGYFLWPVGWLDDDHLVLSGGAKNAIGSPQVLYLAVRP